MKNLFDDLLENGLQEELSEMDDICLWESAFFYYNVNVHYLTSGNILLGFMMERFVEGNSKMNLNFDKLISFYKNDQGKIEKEKTAYIHSIRKIHYFLKDKQFFLAVCCSEKNKSIGFTMKSFREQETFSITLTRWLKSERGVWIAGKMLYHDHHYPINN